MGKQGTENSFVASQAGSDKSQRSRYRTTAKTSHVDTSLFSSKTAKKLESTRAAPLEHHVTKKVVVHKGPSDANAAILLSKKDLQRMLQPAGALSDDQVLQKRLAAQAAAEQETIDRNSQRSRATEKEIDDQSKGQPSEMELLRLQEKAALDAAGRKKQLEQEDEVKAMNRLVTYSRCAAEREQQLQQHQLQLAEAKERERHLDMQMELDRRAALQMYEERDKERAIEQRKGAAVLSEQIHERDMERLRVQDLRYQEGRRMQQMAVEAKEADQRAQEARVLASRELMAAVAESNNALAATKRIAHEQEAEHERQIVEYQRQRDLREQEAAELKAQIAKAKDLEVAKLWASQKKLVDRNSELDELRARRAQDAYERDMRKREADAIARARAIQRDLDEARACQAADRLAARAAQAAFENSEHQRVLQESQQIIQAAAAIEDRQNAQRLEHAEQLRAQIIAREEAAKHVKAAKMAEGAQLRARLAEHKALIEAVKNEKLQELKAQAIPEKYRADLARFKVQNV
ncbi:hypothetical protein WJX73_004960 [Symbiochloris irregularis]|uniref:Cilia- and flagella-associated protein 45 n=1 Tax=Symbiochloris irregularis TaxID=706552 RepID=A0AAW1NTI0_9CHLO